MTKYTITSAVNAIGKQLNLAQRSSSLFSEAPVIGGKILRRGVSIVLEEAQYVFLKSRIDALVKAGAVTVYVSHDRGKVSASVTVDPTEAFSAPKVSGHVTPPEEGLVSPKAKEESTALANEVAAEVAKEVPELITQPEPSQEPAKRGRKPNQAK